MSTTVTISFNRKLILWWGSILAAVLVGWLALSPYVVVWRLQSAAKNQNADALSALVDFESVRSSLKAHLHSQWLDTAADQNGFAALGSAIGAMLVDSIIDRFVTPHGFAALMRNPERGTETEEAPGPPDGVIDDISASGIETRKAYESPNRFVFETWVTSMDDQRVGFTLKRKVLSWRVSGLRLPLAPPDPAPASEPATRPEQEPGYWRLTESVDPIDDSETTTALVMANGGRSLGPNLAVRCAQDETAAFINWTDYLGSANPVNVVVRWNDETARTEQWGASTDHTATFARQPIAFVRALMEHDRLVVRTTPYNEAPATLVFDLTSGSKRFALETIREKCRFEEKERERIEQQRRAAEERRRAEEERREQERRERAIAPEFAEELAAAEAEFQAWKEQLATASGRERRALCSEQRERLTRAISRAADARELGLEALRQRAISLQRNVMEGDC